MSAEPADCQRCEACEVRDEIIKSLRAELFGLHRANASLLARCDALELEMILAGRKPGESGAHTDAAQ